MPIEEQVAVTRVYKRWACWFVEGRVLRDGVWLKAAFTVAAPDVEQMTRDEFHAFALRQLPHVTEDHRYSPTGEVLA